MHGCLFVAIGHSSGGWVIRRLVSLSRHQSSDHQRNARPDGTAVTPITRATQAGAARSLGGRAGGSRRLSGGSLGDRRRKWSRGRPFPPTFGTVMGPGRVCGRKWSRRRVAGAATRAPRHGPRVAGQHRQYGQRMWGRPLRPALESWPTPGAATGRAWRPVWPPGLSPASSCTRPRESRASPKTPVRAQARGPARVPRGPTQAPG
jgi:hypothetical protein